MPGDWATGAALSLSDAAGVYHYFWVGLFAVVSADGSGAAIALATRASGQVSVSLGARQDGARQPQTGDAGNRKICAAPFARDSQQSLGYPRQRCLHQLADTAADEPHPND